MTSLTLNTDSVPLRTQLSTGALEMLKWIALASMVIDHVNRAILNNEYPLMYDIGRLAFPIFGFVLAYNLARPGAFENGVYRRVSTRLLIAGVIATPFYWFAIGGTHMLWPLNIMFSLAAFVFAVWILESDLSIRFEAVVLVIIAGAFVDFFWFGLVYCLAAWCYCKRPAWSTLAIWFFATMCLFFLNEYSLWTFLALPLIAAASYIQLDLPKFKSLFYVIYPLHLALLAAWNVRHSL